GDFSVVGGNRFRVQNGLTLGGTLDLGGSSDPYGASLLFEGDQSLAAGTVRFSGDGFARKLAVEGTSTLTIAPSAVVRGGNGQIGSQLLTIGANSVVNEGLILADDSGGRAITVMPSAFTNVGTARATGAGILTLGAASWANTGTLEAVSGG